MKNYLSNQKLVNAFATFQSHDGKANNMYFSRTTIFSYGYHFPIATRTDEATFFNISKYSNTTAKHQSLVRSALSRYDRNFIECIKVPTISDIECNRLIATHMANLSYWDSYIKNLNEEIANPRVKNKEARLTKIADLEANRTAYKKYFNI
jgi:hypothetical protein